MKGIEYIELTDNGSGSLQNQVTANALFDCWFALHPDANDVPGGDDTLFPIMMTTDLNYYRGRYETCPTEEAVYAFIRMNHRFFNVNCALFTKLS